MQTKWETATIKKACEKLLESNERELYERTAKSILKMIKLSELSNWPYIFLNKGEVTTLQHYMEDKK